MLKTRLLIAAACIGLYSFGATAMPTTDDCLDKGQCAYVSPKGRVTCGKCPTPPRVMKVQADTVAVCNDDTFAATKAKAGACKGHGGVAMSLKPDPKGEAEAKQ